MDQIYDSVLSGDEDAPERFVGKRKKGKTGQPTSPDKKEIKKTPENQILVHLAKMEVYYDELKLTDPEKEQRRLKHIDWVREKLSKEFIEIDSIKEVFIKKVDGGIDGGPIVYNAINSGSGIVHRFVVPRDYKNADEARAVVVKEVSDYLGCWKRASKQFRNEFKI